MEITLDLLARATSDYADRWDANELSLPWVDEYSVPGDGVVYMSDAMRLCYVGRLIRSLALAYGSGSPNTSKPLHPADVLHLVAEAYR